MPTYLFPGIYVEEVPGGARPIEAVGTSTAAFVGITPNPDAHRNEAFPVNNWSQFLREYAPAGAAGTPLGQAVYGFFLNGGGRCYIVNVGTGGSIAGGGTSGRQGLQLLEEVDEVAIVAAPGYADAASYDALLSHCEKLRNRVAILDPPEDVRDITLFGQVATSLLPAAGPASPAIPPPGGTTSGPSSSSGTPPSTPGPAASGGPPTTPAPSRLREARPPRPAATLPRRNAGCGRAPRTAATAPSTSRGSGCAIRSRRTRIRSPSRRPGTWPASGRAPTPRAACTRRRPMSRSGARST
jgi:hypothetical protein